MFRVIQAATCAVPLMPAVPVKAQHAQGVADKHGAEAEKATYPSITAEVDIEIEFDRKYDSDDGTKEVDDLFTETELGLALHLMPGLKIALQDQLKPIRKADPDEDRVFNDHDAIIDAGCQAWNRLIERPWRIMSIGMRQWANSGQC